MVASDRLEIERNNQVLLLTHGEDVDGLISFILLRIYFFDLKVIFVSHKKQRAIFEEIANGGDDLSCVSLIVADLSLKDFLLDSHNDKKSILEKIAKRCQQLIWLDHHSDARRSDFELLGGKFIFGGHNKKCATRLIYEIFFKDDYSFGHYFPLTYDYFLYLSDIAQFNDYPNDPDLKSEIAFIGNRLQRAITCLIFDNNYYLLEKLLNRIVLNHKWELFMGVILKFFHEDFIRAENALKQDSRIILVNEFSFAVSFASPILPQKEVLRYLRKEHKGSVNGCAVLFGSPADSVLFFRDPIKGGFDVQRFCMFMGGGGRDGDGGYSFECNSFSEFIRDFSEKIKSFLTYPQFA